MSFSAKRTDNGNQYRAIFTNASGTATTTAAILTVYAPPIIAVQPSDQTVCEDPASGSADAIFESAASGQPAPTVQWQQSSDAGNTFADIPGATAARLPLLVFRSSNAFQYRATFSNGAGIATSSPAVLTVNTWPAIALHPADQTVAEGQWVTFNAAADGSPTPSIQWQVKLNGSSDW